MPGAGEHGRQGLTAPCHHGIERHHVVLFAVNDQVSLGTSASWKRLTASPTSTSCCGCERGQQT